ncbi:2,5-diamino-6-(ribosylamino)-4(3H)-pyrimidinone 5'-phosphate reductase [Tulasnella sp. 403]|nr:2,5-diamino-6-(ribosylamino)-4(3H)-pyrimidinone 5'-phosphate reductase [Tulasnella sp. 403]
MHDGILVGIGTALNDDPQLNTRRLPPREIPYPQPTPIILDTHLRLPVTAKLVQNYARGLGRQPWVICSKDADPARKAGLEDAGVKVVQVSTGGATGKLDIDDALHELKSLGIKSLMVEGGQRVISTLLSHQSPVFDCLIVTVAPLLVGAAGVGAIADGQVMSAQLLL